MKRLPVRLLLWLFTFLIGVLSVWLAFPIHDNSKISKLYTVSAETKAPTARENNAPRIADKVKLALDDIWIKEDNYRVYGYVITRKCAKNKNSINNCTLAIKLNGKTLSNFEVEPDDKDRLSYGMFNLLGGKNKQLIVHTYSGGAHCCYDYTIFDLKPYFRTLYDSTVLDSGNDIGNELVPIDLNGDGVFEFRQDVMAFDYEAPGGHATSSFPPAIFAYNKQKGRYTLATKLFPNFVIDELKKNLDGLDGWVKDSAKYGSKITREELDEIRVRETFLYWVYAGKRKEAWKYFDKNYNFEFRNKFRKDFKEIFSKDVTYKSIYG